MSVSMYQKGLKTQFSSMFHLQYIFICLLNKEAIRHHCFLAE